MAKSRITTSLYVGNLHDDVTEVHLHEIFQNEHILSIRICRDLETRRSLGYAYINFMSPDDAKEAMEKLNYTKIMGRSCRIMYSERDPTSRNSGVGNVIIKNLDKSITSHQIHKIFSLCGEIKSCQLKQDENGVSQSLAFVSFETDEAAEKAIKIMNGQTIGNKAILVNKFIPKSERNNLYKNCFVKNFGKSLNDASLNELFRKYGEINSAIVICDDDGNSLGYGFVSYMEHDSAARAVKELNGFLIDGKPLYVGKAMKKNERKDVLKDKGNLYIKNFGFEMNDSNLKLLFSKFGAIKSAKVMMHDSDANKSKGFGFVCFYEEEEAKRAVIEMNGKIVNGKCLQVCFAQKKDERLAFLRNSKQPVLNSSKDLNTLGLNYMGLTHSQVEIAKQHINLCLYNNLMIPIINPFQKLQTLPIINQFQNLQNLPQQIDRASADNGPKIVPNILSMNPIINPLRNIHITPQQMQTFNPLTNAKVVSEKNKFNNPIMLTTNTNIYAPCPSQSDSPSKSKIELSSEIKNLENELKDMIIDLQSDNS